MDAHLTSVMSFILHYGYIVIFPIAIAEGPIITATGGFLVSQGYFNFYIMYVVLVIGDLGGDVIYYLLGRFGHILAKSKIGKKIGIKDHHLDKVSGHFDIHSGKTLIFGKLTHSLGAFILTGAGVAKMPIGKFLWYNLLGTLPKALALMLIGYYFGYAFEKIDTIMGKTIFILGVVLVGAMIVYSIHYYFKQKKLAEILESVMVFGVFDNLHDGHRFFLDKASAIGDRLIIVVARDHAVFTYKNRLPTMNQSERMAEVKKAYPKAMVVLGDEKENSWKVLEHYKPKTIALGYDQNELRERLEAIKDTFDTSIKLTTIEDHRGEELHSSLLRNK